jgi:hypothetical protein
MNGYVRGLTFDMVLVSAQRGDRTVALEGDVRASQQAAGPARLRSIGATGYTSGLVRSGRPAFHRSRRSSRSGIGSAELEGVSGCW